MSAVCEPSWLLFKLWGGYMYVDNILIAYKNSEFIVDLKLSGGIDS